jgi:hypothetical protein
LRRKSRSTRRRWIRCVIIDSQYWI